MKGFVDNIEKLAIDGVDFRKVLYTGKHTQLVIMSLKPKEEIGLEVHSENDQFIRFESGEGKVVIDGVEHQVEEDDAVIIPAGAEHNVINTSEHKSLKLYTLYAPPHHRDGVVHATKADAEKSDEDFDGVTSE